MAYYTRDQVRDIISKAPPGYTPEQVVGELVRQGHELEGYSEKQPGIVQQVVRGYARPFLKAGATVAAIGEGAANLAQAAGDYVTGDRAGYERNVQEGLRATDPSRERDFGYLGKARPVGSARDAIGTGLEIGASVIGGGGAAAVGKATLAGRALQGAGRGIMGGAGSGLFAGAGQGLQDETASAGDVIRKGAAWSLFGAIGGGAVGGAAPVVSRIVVGGRNVIAPSAEEALMRAIKPASSKTDFERSISRAIPALRSESAASGKPIQNLQDMVDVGVAAKKKLWDSYQRGLLGNQTRPGTQKAIDGNGIADAIEGTITPRFERLNPAKAEQIRRFAATYRRDIPLGEAEDLLQEVNADLYSYYAKNKVGQQVAKADAEVGYAVAEAEALRNNLYRILEGSRELKQTYGALSEVVNEATKRAVVEARQAPFSLGEQIGAIQAVGNFVESAGNLQFVNAVKGAGQFLTANFLKRQNQSSTLVRKAFRDLPRVRMPQ